MANLIDMKDDLIIINPDTKTRTAFDTWEAGLGSTERANFTVINDKLIISAPNPDDSLKDTRQAFVDLVDTNADTPTDIVRLQFFGTSFAMIVNKVADPDNEEPK